MILTTITIDASTRHRADELDAEAAYYHRRAIQEQQALGPGYYIDLLRTMATDWAAMAQQIRTGKTQHHQRLANPAKHAFPNPPAIDPSTHRGKHQISDDSN
ncbi:MAG: hypothetical protein JO287_04645 [Pseudonocardiales bacterium]|nr:hypothetical protein [Pseudonocardiales bacterium]